LDAYREVDVVSEVAGQITALHRDVGDLVSREGLLASVDKEMPRETLNQAEASLMAAEARFRLAREDYLRDSTLYANGDVAQAAYDAGHTAYRSALAELKATRAARELAARDLREADIRAPFPGAVSRRYCEIGSYVTPGMPLFRIVDIDSLRLVLNVSQRDVADVELGSEVIIAAETFGDRTFMGTIRSIAPEADEATRTFPVEVILANTPDGSLRDGLVVRATLPLNSLENAIALPREAVLKRTGGEFVFVVEDSLAHERAVTTGPLVEDHYVIEQGLQPGEWVVVSGMANLKDSSLVSVDRPLDPEFGGAGGHR
jgi:RND family efflux transporter MFP subunit